MLNTRLIMISSAVVLGLAGLLMQFLPHDVLRFFDAGTGGFTAVLVQLIGAVYLGFAMMNWMAKGVLIGGIYARPLAMGNLVHFVVGGLALLKFAFANGQSAGFWAAAAVYMLFAVFFGLVLFSDPLGKTEAPQK